MSEYKGYTHAQSIATNKYKKKKNIVRLSIDLPAEKREEYKRKAESKGMSLSKYITALIERDK